MKVLEFPKILGPGVGKEILIVDDVDDFRDDVRLKISNRFPGVQIKEAQSGIMASVELRRNNFDLVISDLRMPDGDGLWLHFFMQEYYCHIPLMFLTASPEAVPQTLKRKIFAKGDVQNLLSELLEQWSSNEVD